MADGNGRVALQVAVDGLLQFLRIKGGQGPYAMGLTVEPSIDVTDFYGVQSAVIGSDTGVAGVITAGLIGTVPNQPRRYTTLSAGIIIGAAAGTYLTLAVGFRDPLNNRISLNSLSLAPVATGVYRVSAFILGLVAPPTWAPAVFVDGNAAGADHVPFVQYSYQRLDGLP